MGNLHRLNPPLSRNSTVNASTALKYRIGQTRAKSIYMFACMNNRLREYCGASA